MDLHFCSRCGISIPQSEIDQGAAAGAGGKYFCSEHRSGSSVAVAEHPLDEALAKFSSGVPGEDPELLFCANCRVSIPQDDSRSGRAHREFGSLLCAGCSKADPGERAARREAVEAEMAADVDAQDPVVARRCSVCSAAVPYGQIVTGKAKVEGNRVVCERCRAATSATPGGEAKPSGMSPGLVLAIVVLVAGGLGYFATQAWIDQKRTADQKASSLEAQAVRADIEERFKSFDDKFADALKKSSEPDKDAVAARERADAEVANLRQVISDLRADKAKSDAELAQRATKLEVEVEALKERIRDLASRPTAPAPAAPPPEEKRSDAPPATAPAGPAAAPKGDTVDPAVAKLCKDLLERQDDDGIRFAAARELTTLKDPAAIPSLVKALGDDKHYFVRRGCARALGVIKAWLAVPALIRALEDREVYVALAANIALQSVTGYDAGVTQDTPAGQRKTKAQAADKWWEKNKDHPPDGVSLHPITD